MCAHSTTTSLHSFQASVEQAEQAYEFMISFAGQGIGREDQREQDTDEIRSYLLQLKEALLEGCTHASAIPEEHDLRGETYYTAFVEQLRADVEAAVVVLDLLAAQDKITSVQIDDLNGMIGFQSIVMKLFFLDDLTEHLSYE